MVPRVRFNTGFSGPTWSLGVSSEVTHSPSVTGSVGAVPARISAPGAWSKGSPCSAFHVH